MGARGVRLAFSGLNAARKFVSGELPISNARLGPLPVSPSNVFHILDTGCRIMRGTGLLGSVGSLVGTTILTRVLGVGIGGGTAAAVTGAIVGSRAARGRGLGAGLGAGFSGAGRGQSQGSISESFIEVIRELKKPGAPLHGMKKGGGCQTASRSKASPMKSAAKKPDPETAPVKEENLSAIDLGALEVFSSCIASFVDGRARVRHDGLAEEGVVAPLTQLLEARGLVARFNPRAASVLLVYDPNVCSRADFLCMALPLARYLRDCELALEDMAKA